MATISSLVLTDVNPIPRQTEQLDSPTTPRQASYGPGPAIESEPVQSNDTQQPTTSLPPNPPSNTSSSAPSAPELVSKPEDDLDADDDGEEKMHAMDLDVSDNDQDDSDNDADQGDGDGSKKKRGQRFFCSGYPPCNLSFTRSEHLARHIRKHTGERPFQCHCNRRFSRLDNLRQHAQTVHVNEEIPGDSLAATGTRFQRQIRTDRVRPTGRPRTGTMGSTGSHSRGHSRNLSASSVGSTSSNYSTIGEAKRRPPPLLMANDSSSRPKLGLETPTTPPQGHRVFHPDSPTSLTTPTSATFSTLPGSPAYGSSMDSPASSAPRLSGGFNSRPPSRRLSVPSGRSPYQTPYPSTYPPPQPHPMGPPPSNPSSASSTYASPTTAGFSYVPNAYQVQSHDDWRRRTWHSSYSGGSYHYTRPATSSLTYSQTPDAPQPAYAQHAPIAAGQATRLPGIESFDQVQIRPASPPRRHLSPMQIDPPRHSHLHHSSVDGHLALRSGQQNWQPPQQSHYPAIDDNPELRRASPSWGQQALNEIRNVGSTPPARGPPSGMAPPPLLAPPMHHQQIAQEALQVESSAKRTKRHGWYNGPASHTRTSPEDSSSSEGVATPGTSTAEIHPTIIHSNGFVESHHHPLQLEAHQAGCLPTPQPSHWSESGHRPRNHSFDSHSTRSGDMNRLEALVAVATSSHNTTTTTTTTAAAAAAR